MAYATDADLAKFRQDINDLGVSAWTNQHAEATRIIDRALEVGWYRSAATERGIDWQQTQYNSALLLSSATQLNVLGVYCALMLAYDYLMTSTDTDGPWHALGEFYATKFQDELKAILSSGLDYDWDSSGSIEASEYAEQRMPRTLVRM